MNIPEYPAPLEQEPPSTAINHAWNAFDVEMIETEPVVTTDILATLDASLDLGSDPLSLSEPVAFEDCVTPALTTDQLDHVTPHVQENSSSDALPDVEVGTPHLLSASCVTVSKQNSDVPSSISICSDSHQEPDQPAPPGSGNSLSSLVDPGHRDKNTAFEPCHALNLGENPRPSAADAPGRAEDVGTTKDNRAAEDDLTTSSRSTQPSRCSSPKYSGGQTATVVDGAVRSPSIAVVVPAPSWKQGRVTRASTRAAAAACKKRLRSSRGGSGNHGDPDASSPNPERPSRRIKPRAAGKSFSHPLGDSAPASCHCSPDIYGVRGSALLTVQHASRLKPAYYFTFVPDASSMSSHPLPADIPGKQRPYSSDENALLVRLKEREGMPWAAIAKHFPDRQATALQVHYSTKLRRKARSRSGNSKDADERRPLPSPSKMPTDQSLCSDSRTSQSQHDRSETQQQSRKGLPWSTEEVDLLLKLRRDEKRPWNLRVSPKFRARFLSFKALGDMASDYGQKNGSEIPLNIQFRSSGNCDQYDADKKHKGIRHARITSRLLFDLFCLTWIAPVVILLLLNFKNWIIGAGVACRIPSFKNDCNIWGQNSQSQIKLMDDKDHEILGALQIVAKALDVWFTIVVSSLVLDLAILLAKSTGLPMGYFMTYIEFTDVTTLLNPTFWKSSGNFEGQSRWREASRRWAFVAFVTMACIASNLMGPATAVLAIPTLGWSDDSVSSTRTFGDIAASEPPKYANIAPDCEESALAARNYTCTLYFSANLDEMLAGARWRNQLSKYRYSDQIFVINNLAFRPNSSINVDRHIESIRWTPNRKLAKKVNRDYGEVFYSKSKDSFQKANASLSRPLEKRVFDLYRNSIDIEIHRKGPSLGYAESANSTLNEQLVEYTLPQSLSLNTTILCRQNTYLTFPDYNMRITPSEINSTLVTMEIPSNVSASGIFLHPDWILAAWSVSPSGIVDAKRPAASDIMVSLKEVADTQPPKTQEEQASLKKIMDRFFGLHTSVLEHALTLVDYSVLNDTEASKTITEDAAHPLLPAFRRFRVWSYGDKSRTFKLGAAVSIFGCICVIIRTVVSQYFRINRPSTVEIVAAALKYTYQGDLDGVRMSSEAGKLPFGYHTAGDLSLVRRF
ncbi:uncharacterized protein ATNIH1004_011574 [Aspergillus tanneri]|uniref:Myb-like domain-containing protein n=1 Tax=Aspergillus tanneri TaxID=1220188 RepID=A0A5M9MDM6_9EURO|nr:uncharacterized protein ATNIH1004_011574 [Aspergillus tanneri]KAA8642629.1 hypothetical protein ATNIH1004_011574 [Aspergillus tanneri]